jgi:phosphate transport system permease protein
VQIFTWVNKPQQDFHELAAAASIVLLAALLTLNAAAILLRNRYSRRS